MVDKAVDKAVEKLTKEMMELDDPLAIAIEEYLTNKCTTVSIAEKLLVPEKTLKIIHKQIWDEARKRKKGNVAYIPPDELYRMIDEYYELASTKSTKIDILDLI